MGVDSQNVQDLGIANPKSIQMGEDSQNVQDLGNADPKKYPDGCRLSECSGSGYC